jgi:hypothetical protein
MSPLRLIVRAVLVALMFVLASPAVPAWASAHNAPMVVQMDGFNLSEITLPGFTNLSAYTENYRGQYPTVGFSGQCSAGMLYITNASRMACFTPANGTSWNISSPIRLLYQETAGLQAQIDNEFQLDTPYDIALLYGNLSKSAGNVTVETVNLTTGAIHLATSPVRMENGIQADYVGGGNVVIFNATNIGGSPTWFTNVLNGTSWEAGLSLGISPDNIYWVWQLRSFIDVQGLHMTQFKVSNGALVDTSSVYFNHTGLSNVTAVDGLQFGVASSRFAVDLSTNLGSYIAVGKISHGKIEQHGSYAFLSSRDLYVQRYSYSSNYLWAMDGSKTILFDPIDNLSLPAPNLVGRQDGSGANGNFEFANPYCAASYLSLNESLVGLSTRAPNEFVWANQNASNTTLCPKLHSPTMGPSSPGHNSNGARLPGSSPSTKLGPVEIYDWPLLVPAAVVFASVCIIAWFRNRRKEQREG